MKASNLLQRPWQKLGADLFELEGNMCLVIMDFLADELRLTF